MQLPAGPLPPTPGALPPAPLPLLPAVPSALGGPALALPAPLLMFPVQATSRVESVAPSSIPTFAAQLGVARFFGVMVTPFLMGSVRKNLSTPWFRVLPANSAQISASTRRAALC